MTDGHLTPVLDHEIKDRDSSLGISVGTFFVLFQSSQMSLFHFTDEETEAQEVSNMF